jgi:hypothetical protein
VVILSINKTMSYFVAAGEKKKIFKSSQILFINIFS